MSEPLISCIIAAHNDGRYLRDSIPSVLNQTHRNLECFLVDDGSTDGTADNAKNWLGDERFTYIAQSHSGVAKARNEGVRRSQGEYIAFLDADDCWDSGKLEAQLRFLNSHLELGFCWCDQEQMDDNGTPLGRRVVFAPDMPVTNSILLSGWGAPPSCWFLKRELFETVKGFDENLASGHEDVELVFRMANCTQGARSPESFVWRRIRHNSISRDVRLKRHESLRVCNKMLSFGGGKYRHLRRQAMFAVHRFLSGHCWENRAYGAATIEAVKAAFWNPMYVFDRAFIDTLALGHIHNMVQRKKP